MRANRTFFAIAGLLLASAASPAGAADKKTFIALLNGSQETPANTSQAFGVAFMTFDEATKMLCYAITHSRLEGGNEVAAHFHGPAEPDEAADVVFAITPPGPTKKGCVGPLNGKQKKDLKKGHFYVNVHTQQFPGGEIRGQVLATK